MKKIAKLSTLLSSLLLLTTLAACGGGNDKKESKPNKPSVPVSSSQSGSTSAGTAELVDKNASGELTVMVWAGDGQLHKDIGHAEWAPNEISGHNTAMIYGIAKEFNKVYPNIKINLFSKANDPEDWR